MCPPVVSSGARSVMLSTFVAAVLAFASTLSDVQVIELAEAVRGLMREPAPLDSEHAGYLESALPKIVSFARRRNRLSRRWSSGWRHSRLMRCPVLAA